MDRYWAANFAKFVIFACPLSVIGYQMFNSLLLFKYEIKQNVSNTNIVKNKIGISFAMVSMVGATICILQISRNLQKARNHKFREICEKRHECTHYYTNKFREICWIQEIDLLPGQLQISRNL